jgi:hypothetical protein
MTKSEARVLYDPEQDTVLTLTTIGDRSVGIWPSTFTLVLPFSEKMMKEDRDWAAELKQDVAKALKPYADDGFSEVLYDWEIEELADAAEEQSERERGQYD